MAVTIINACGLLSHFLLKRELESVRQPTSAIGGKFPVFSGVEIGGESWRAQDAPCRVIRVTADSCDFCSRDRPAYEALLDAARGSSCEILELSPKAGQMADDPRPGVIQLKFVDVDLGSVLAPYVTPQTIILDRDWSLRWMRRGMFDDDSLANSIASVKALAPR